MEPFWSNRMWDAYVDAYYAKFRVDFDSNTTHWAVIASKRYSL